MEKIFKSKCYKSFKQMIKTISLLEIRNSFHRLRPNFETSFCINMIISLKRHNYYFFYQYYMYMYVKIN